MAFCPNKNLRAWIDLEIAQPERSYQLWDEYKGNVPSKYYNVKPLLDKVKKELKFRSPLFTSELILLKSRLKDYNTKNGTSHKLNITKIGESDRHKVDLYLDYTPVNEEMRREREAIRSEEGKSFYNIEETNREDIVNPLIEEARRIQLEDAKRAGIDYDDRYLFNQTIGIKPGVAELFESNPELANAVYEALGFKSNLKTSLGKELEYKDEYVPTNRLKDFKQYQVLDEKGNDIGSVVIEYRGSKNVILHPKLKIEGKGYGKDLYKFISNKFNVEIQEWKEGHIANSSAAKKMWDSLEKEGTAKRIIDKGGDNFRVLNYRQQITPQQKQEAQKLYSQYLDTIFPDSKVKEIVYHGSKNADKILQEGFKEGFEGTANKGVKGFHFAFEKQDADYFATQEGKILSALVNVTSEDLIDVDEILIYSNDRIHILGTKQDIEVFKEFVNKSVTTEISFDKELHNKIEEILKKLYPEINLTISKLPKFEGGTENIIGQANIKAFTVLIDAINQKQDTLPHEYAHHYIAWFRNTPIVQEAIKKWGSEESLVQAIGEQVVKQKGEAWNWWKEFSEWVKNIFNKLSDKSKEELRDILTSAFLQRIDVRTGRTLDIDSIKALVSPEIWNQTNTSKVDNSGSKKKLSNLKDAFETILDKLERRRKILENLGKEKQTKIYNTIIAKLETQYKAEKYLEGINLFLIEGHNMFDSIQKDLKKFYDGKYNANVIRRMGSFASSFKVMLEETSRGLYEERKDATGDRLNKIKELQVRVAELQDIVKNVKEDWLELSRRVTSEFLYAFDQYRTKEELYNILSKPVKDISTPNTWFNSILESNDEMSRLIGKAVSDTRELARLEVLRTQQDFVDLKKELEKGGIKDTSWMYSTYNGNKTEEFVSERDWAYYNNLKSELYKEANKIFEDLDIGYYEYLDMSKGDKAKFINSLSPSKKSQFNTFKTKEKKFYAENTLSEIEVLRLKDEMINKLSKEDYEIWLKLNVEVRNGKEIVPSKKSVQYIEIQSNPLKKKFYDKVMKHKVELTDSFPDKFKEYRLAPQIRKDSIERLKGKDFSGLMADAKESYKIFEDEEKRGSNLRLIDEEGNLVNFIPIYFSNKIKDINNLTDDVASSMIAFVNMGINRRALTGILDSLELSREVIKARGILRVDSLGRPIKGKKKFAGKEEIEEQINIEKGAGRVYEMLNQFLLDTVYGQKDVPLGEVMGVDVARLIDTLSMHTALVQLGVNIYAGIANVNVAKAMIRIEAASGQFFSFRDVLYADQIYAKELPKTLGDIGQRKFNSKVTLWLEKHDTLENYNEEIAGLDLERKTMFSRLFNKSALFFLSRSGEHYIHGRGSIALSNQFRFDKSTNRFVHKSKFYSELRDLEFKKKEEINNLGDKLKQLKKEGKLKDTIKSINDKYSPIIESKKKELDAEWDKMTNYWDAHEVVNNRLVLKDEFKGSNWQQDHLDYTNMQHAINQELHGNYGPYGAALQRYAWGRAIMMFHKWLKPYWDRRYKRLRYDHRKQSDVEGYYTTVFNFAMQLAKDMRDGQYSLLKNWSALTTQEKANFNRAFTEVAYVLSLAVLSAAIMSIREGGDDDSWAINMTAYQLNRLITEVGVMTPSPLMFSESLRLIQSPAASVHMVDDLFKVFDVTSWFKEIERGRYKDMYGIQRNIIKVTPILKQAFDYSYPEEKLVFYNSSK